MKVSELVAALVAEQEAQEFDRVKAECEADEQLYRADPEFARLLGITPFQTKNRLRDAEKKRNPRGLRGKMVFKIHRADGRVETIEALNIIPNAALNDSLDVWLSGGTQDTTLFLGLKGAGSTSSSDTMASHAGWSEVTAYDEAARQAWVDGGVSSQTVSNSGSPAVYTISTNATGVSGAFLTGLNTKGGTTGVLYAVVNFTAGAVTLNDNDTLTVTYTVTAADDGI